MFTNHIKLAFRNLRRNKVFSFINITGLAMGIAAFLLLLEYISLEQSVNKFHANLPSMYRLINESPDGKTWPEVEPGWAMQARQRYPEIKEYCRFEEGIAQGIVTKNDNSNTSYRESGIGYADGNFFNLFSFSLLNGNATDLEKPNTVYLSASTVKKYFGKENAIGKTLVLNNQFGKAVYTVSGVYEDMKENSDIRYDMVFSLETLKDPANLNSNDWAAPDNLNSQYINTFFLLNKNSDVAALEKKLNTLRDELKKDKDGVRFRLQAFSNVHLGTSLGDSYPTTGNLKYIYVLGGISLLILVIAWFNYVNLSTANSFKRAGEVGVRKVIGASRSNLVLQFMGESLLINLLGFLFAIVLILLLQPLFNKLVDKPLSLQTITSSTLWIYGLLLLMLGSIFSGGYTAFVLSGFKPLDILKGKVSKTSKGIFLRRSLVVSQFVISIALIIATLTIFGQLRFMQNKNLGLNTSELLVLRGPEVGKDSTYKNRKEAFINTLASKSFVQDYCVSGSVPGNFYSFVTGGFTQPASKKGDELKNYSFAIISDRFLKTYGIPLVAGRNFTAQECAVEWNDNSKVLMNEQAIRQLGFKNPEEALHVNVQWDERPLQIIGVVKDYHHLGVQHAIDPVIFYPQNTSSYYTVRLSPGNTPEKIASLEKAYKESFAGNPFEYFFEDEKYDKLYASEKQYGHIFTTASIWAIFIACLGLFGLASFTVESRVKEIGVRKVLGAGVGSIVTLLSKDLLRLVLIAFIIASPIAWYFMHKWLQDFAYHINVGWWSFLLAGSIAILIALATVGFRAMKAALANPVKSLRTE
ncbi:ABC transporter permease [Ferruginibacter sp. HRS2-29]|uniref:ABC transporter permease n=1 Tax=Ferruginibacter sp. HRS2-29 TaxID=2487334 RepID=UPI0020CCB2BA|nr:ABC transporter permease [Ferruginibacter sp. HRS2-29]MCP9749811.1 FtsX-like permease family protein [Ferruginibacter sp. HRS2-29]